MTLPPGRERLSTSPILSGYEEVVITIGIVLVACLAARIACVPDATMMSGLSATSSIARAGKRSGLPSDHRHSIVTLRPST